MKTKTPQQLGKEFEKDIGDEIKERMKRERIYCHRLYDSTSAGTHLPSQPGDYIVICYGQAHLVEVKTSAEFESLAGLRKTLNLFDSAQVSKMRLWTRAEGTCTVIFKSQETDNIEVWDGNYIAECFITPRKRVEEGSRLFESSSIKEILEFVLKGSKL